MLKLEDIKPGAQIQGLAQEEIVRIVQLEPLGRNALAVYYKGTGGQLQDATLFRDDEARLELATAGRAWAFDALADGFKLGLAF